MKYDREIIDTKHSIERFALGRNLPPNYTSKRFKQDMTWTINNAMKKIIDEYKDESRVYVVHSRSTRIGVVLEWRKDYYSESNINCAVIITVLPFKGSHYPTRSNDRLLLVESLNLFIEQNSDMSDEEFRRVSLDNFHVAVIDNKYYDCNGEFLLVN